LPEPMRLAIARNVPVTRSLPPDLARRLDGLIISFLVEKQFVGCNGLAITDEIRGTIAAQACLLLLGRLGLYDELQSILVYPGAFWVEDEVHDDDGLVTQRRRELSGEAWDSHRIILSWEDVEETARRPADGYNVVLHEFAHYLDAEGRGLPPLPPPPLPPSWEKSPEGRVRAMANGRLRGIDDWHRELVAECEALRAAVDRAEPTFLDPYAAEDENEFFAVVSEEFIECPAELRTAHPRLYALMREFYGIDPAAWAMQVPR
jgi:Mlc titration factor MtfA (ptsG expression regulator)